MGCCRKIRYYSKTRSVLCLKWVQPIRILALLSLVIHIVITLLSKTDHTIISTFVAVIHLSVVYLLLKECYVSMKYHALLQQNTRQ